MKTHRWLAIPMVLVGGTLWLGCSSGDDPVDEGPKYKYPDLSSFCEAKAERECTDTVLGRCQTTLDDCLTTRRGICGQAKPAGTDYRPTEAETCLATVAAAYADDEYTAEEQAAEQEACALLYGGAGVEGSSCTQDYQCDLDADLRCVIPTGEATGRCYVPVETGPGESCDSASAVCAEGYYCSAIEHICAARAKENASCSATKLCQDDLLCIGEEDAATCQPKSTTGAECTVGDECESGMCSQVGSVNKCVTSVILAPNEPICDDFR